MALRIRGLKEFDRALAKADVSMQLRLRVLLKEAAEIVAVRARQKAEPMRKSGDQIRGIQPYAAVGSAGVRSSASHRGFSYPRRLEFEGREGRDSGAYGPRATLLPAFDEKQPEVERAAELLLDRVTRELGGST